MYMLDANAGIRRGEAFDRGRALDSVEQVQDGEQLHISFVYKNAENALIARCVQLMLQSH